MEIRLATVDDAQAIYEIEQQSFSVPWSLESVLAELEGADNKLYMVICEGNHIVGYAGAKVAANAKGLVIKKLQSGKVVKVINK